MSNAFLRLISTSGAFGQQENSYSLLTANEVIIGREASCQIVLNSSKYGMVSRRHVSIRSSRTPDGNFSFLLCDLSSANGTYLNGQRLHGCQELHPGDRLRLGSDGPEFVFEQEYNPQKTVGVPQPPVKPVVGYGATSPSPSPFPNSNSDDQASFTQLIPLFSVKDLTRKAYLVPGIITVVFVVLLFVVNGFAYQLLLGLYLAGAALYVIYQLCGKRKPWWVLIATAISTMVILVTPILSIFIIVFRGILPGNIPRDPSSASFIELFIHFFFGAGLLEELLKMLPVIGFYLLGRTLTSPRRERIGVWEPLDGILLGAASAVGFTLIETLGQYVPGQIAQVSQSMGADAGLRAGLQLLIPRVLGEIAGHMAWSGWFGYCIGLAILKPRLAWRTLLVGYLSAAFLHALWDSSAGLASSLGIFLLVLLIIIGGLSYALLAAAIVKARSLSPTRSSNFATRFIP